MKRLITERDIPALAEELWALHDSCAIYTLSGPLGSGKTTLVKALLKVAGVTEQVVSPTFIYMIRYANSHDQFLIHYDLYRMRSKEDFIEQGLDEFLYAPNCWCFIEWPEIIEPLLSRKVCRIRLAYHNAETREVEYQLT